MQDSEAGVQVTKDVFESAGGKLKVVGRAGVGVDNVDLSSATEVQHLGPDHCMQGAVGSCARPAMPATAKLLDCSLWLTLER